MQDAVEPTVVQIFQAYQTFSKSVLSFPMASLFRRLARRRVMRNQIFRPVCSISHLPMSKDIKGIAPWDIQVRNDHPQTIQSDSAAKGKFIRRLKVNNMEARNTYSCSYNPRSSGSSIIRLFGIVALKYMISHRWESELAGSSLIHDQPIRRGVFI